MRGLGVAASRAAVVGLALVCLCVIPRAMCAPDTSSSKWDDASLLEPGQEQTTRSSADGPVLFRIVHTGGDVSADIRVTNLETHLATQPVGHVYASRGNKLDVATAKVLSTRASPAILEIGASRAAFRWTPGAGAAHPYSYYTGPYVRAAQTCATSKWATGRLVCCTHCRQASAAA